MVNYYCANCKRFFIVQHESTCPSCKNEVKNEKIDSLSIKQFDNGQTIKNIKMNPIVFSTSNEDTSDFIDSSFQTKYLKKASLLIILKNILISIGIIIGIMLLTLGVKMYTLPMFGIEFGKSTISSIIIGIVNITAFIFITYGLVMFFESIFNLIGIPFIFKGTKNEKNIVKKFFNICLKTKSSLAFFRIYPIAFFNTTLKAKKEYGSYMSFMSYWANVESEIKSLASRYNWTSQEKMDFSFNFDNIEFIDMLEKPKCKSFIVNIKIKLSKDKLIPIIPLQINGEIESINGKWLINTSFYFMEFE
jgi:RNA polymerase subunit RPABC4/transcription elongation factor Spt4